MFDTFPDPAGNIPTSHYGLSSNPCEASGSTVSMGISGGWGDYYPRSIANQWIVVTGLDAGTYTLRSTVNPGREFIEANYDDNVLEETREIPGATAADIVVNVPTGTPTTIVLSGTVEGRTVQVAYQGGPTHDSAGPTLSFATLSQTSSGTLGPLSATGDTTATLTYTPAPGFTGSDGFTYQTTDDRGLTSNPATVSIAVGNPPANSSPPTVSGIPVVDETLSASPGGWTGDGELSFLYRWQRCESDDCADIPGSTAAIHVVGAGDVGSSLRVVATAASPFGSATAASAATSRVTALPLVRDRKSKLARQQVIGSGFADFLAGTAAHELFKGLGGPDRIEGEGGSDLAYGGRGRDVLVLGNGADTGYGGKGRDTLKLGNGADTGYGDRGPDLLIGGNGRDSVFGNQGNDRIKIRDGKPDQADCGTGHDVVVADAKDTIDESCEVVKLPKRATA